MISCQRSAFPNHPMTGHNEGNRVSPDGGAHRPRGFGLAERSSQIAIGGQSSEGNRQQRLPDPNFEIAADHHNVERLAFLPKIGREGPLDGRSRQFFILDETRFRPPACHIGHRGLTVPVVNKAQSCKPMLGDDRNRFAKR